MARAPGNQILYLSAMLLNVAVGVMFFVINIRPDPPQLVSYTVVHHVPVIHKAIIKQATIGTPDSIKVPSLGIDLAVSVGSFNTKTGSWTLSDDRAYYADTSVPANDNNGRTLIYAHALWGVFGSLPDIKVGASAQVTTTNGYVFQYTYQQSHDLKPSDVSIFTTDGPPTLVLQTCSGEWDSYRTMYFFHFESVRRL